jgi:hypothetical protein
MRDGHRLIAMPWADASAGAPTAPDGLGNAMLEKQSRQPPIRLIG